MEEGWVIRYEGRGLSEKRGGIGPNTKKRLLSLHYEIKSTIIGDLNQLLTGRNIFHYHPSHAQSHLIVRKWPLIQDLQLAQLSPWVVSASSHSGGLRAPSPGRCSDGPLPYWGHTESTLGFNRDWSVHCSCGIFILQSVFSRRFSPVLAVILSWQLKLAKYFDMSELNLQSKSVLRNRSQWWIDASPSNGLLTIHGTAVHSITSSHTTASFPCSWSRFVFAD